MTVEMLWDATGADDIVNAAGAADAETVHATLMALLHSNWAAVASSADWAAAMETRASLPKGSLVQSAAVGAGQS